MMCHHVLCLFYACDVHLFTALLDARICAAAAAQDDGVLSSPRSSHKHMDPMDLELFTTFPSCFKLGRGGVWGRAAATWDPKVVQQHQKLTAALMYRTIIEHHIPDRYDRYDRYDSDMIDMTCQDPGWENSNHLMTRTASGALEKTESRVPNRSALNTQKTDWCFLKLGKPQIQLRLSLKTFIILYNPL